MRAIGLQYADSHFHYVVLSSTGEVASRGAIPANRDDLRRAFRAIEPTCIAMDGTSSVPWAVDLLSDMHHAVHVDSRLLLAEGRGDLPFAEGVDASVAAAHAERNARQLRERWTRGIAALRAASRETAIYA
jgi:hypothetical protein